MAYPRSDFHTFREGWGEGKGILSNSQGFQIAYKYSADLYPRSKDPRTFPGTESALLFLSQIISLNPSDQLVQLPRSRVKLCAQSLLYP